MHTTSTPSRTSRATRSATTKRSDETIYQVGVFTSALGNSISAVVLPLLVLAYTKSVISAALVSFVGTFPQLFVAVISGVMIDRFGARKVMVVGDSFSVLALLGLMLGALTNNWNIWWFLVCNFLAGIGDVPALTARELAAAPLAQQDDDKLKRIVSTREALQLISMVTGPLIGVVLLEIQDSVPILTSALLSLFALLTATKISIGKYQLGKQNIHSVLNESVSTDSPIGTTNNASRSRKNYEVRNDYFDGLRIIVSSRSLAVVVLTAISFGGILAVLQGLVLPVFFTANNATGYSGVSLSLIALGGIFGSALFVGLSKVLNNYVVYLLGAVVSVIGMCLIATTLIPVVIVGTALTGLGLGIVSAQLGTLSLTIVEPNNLGKVLGYQNALTLGLGGLLYFLVALLLEATNVMVVTLVGAGILFAVNLFGATTLKQNLWTTNNNRK